MSLDSPAHRVWKRAASTVLLSSSLALGACTDTDEAQAPTTAELAPDFVDRVWRVRESTAVAPGTLYVFLSEGTLVIASPHGTPALGTWQHEDGGLTMVEEGIPYRVEILQLADDEFRIRSHNPGEPVDITMVPAAAGRTDLPSDRR